MSIERTVTTTLHCDYEACLGQLQLVGLAYLSNALIERYAREKGWRKDKLHRNVCPAHPKLKGAR